jgi:hypothetical protein
MAEPVKSRFKEECLAANLWTGGRSASQQDLSAYFTTASVRSFLKDKGRFAFVMPAATLNLRQYEGFRHGEWGGVSAAFDPSWRLVHVTSNPPYFPVPCAVIFGTRSHPAAAMPEDVTEWTGKLPDGGSLQWSDAEPLVETTPGRVKRPRNGDHPYRDDFRNGATLYPRNFVFVTERDPGQIGVGQGRSAVTSWRSSQGKEPWKSLESLTGVIEDPYLRPAYLGQDLLPYRITRPLNAVVPWDGSRMVDHTTASAAGLIDWWQKADDLWRLIGFQRGVTVARRSQLGFPA